MIIGKIYILLFLTLVFFVGLAPSGALARGFGLVPDNAVFELMPVEAEIIETDGTTAKLKISSGASIKQGDIFTVFKYCGKFSLCGIALLSVTEKSDSVVFASLVKRLKSDTLAVGQTALRFSDIKGGVLYAGSLESFSEDALDMTILELLEYLPQIEWKRLVFYDGISPERLMADNSVDLLFVIHDDSTELFLSGKAKTRRYGMVASKGEKEGGRAAMLPANALRLSALTRVGKIPFHVIDMQITDIDRDGSEEIVTLTRHALSVSPYGHDGAVLTYDIQGVGIPSGCSVSQHGRWVAVNRYVSGYGMNSILLRTDGHELKPVRDDINLWLNFMELDSEENSLLAGQPWKVSPVDVLPFFHVIRPDTDRIIYGERITLPPGFVITDLFHVRFAGYAAMLLCAFDRQGMLHIFKRNRLIWTALDEQKAMTNDGLSPGINAVIYRQKGFGDLLLYPSESGNTIWVMGGDANGRITAQAIPVDMKKSFYLMELYGKNMFFAVRSESETDDEKVLQGTVLYRAELVSGNP